jgi:hypothetical protein
VAGNSGEAGGGLAGCLSVDPYPPAAPGKTARGFPGPRCQPLHPHGRGGQEGSGAELPRHLRARVSHSLLAPALLVPSMPVTPCSGIAVACWDSLCSRACSGSSSSSAMAAEQRPAASRRRCRAACRQCYPVAVCTRWVSERAVNGDCCALSHPGKPRLGAAPVSRGFRPCQSPCPFNCLRLAPENLIK